MQSDTVIGMMLNFAALLFVSEIDNIAFNMAKLGFVTNAVQEEARAVNECSVPCRRCQMKSSNKCRRSLYLMVVIGLMIGYAIIVKQQKSGRFLPNSVGVQFPDEYDRASADFSGVFVQDNERFGLINGRVVYIEQKKGQAMLAYCAEEEAWTFSRWATNDPDNKIIRKWFPDEKNYVIGDPCHWFAKSSTTVSYDVSQLANQEWYVYYDTLKQAVPYTGFKMFVNDCESSGLCHEENGICTENGCECLEGHYGLNCEFENPCEELVMDKRKQKFPSDLYANEFYLLKDDNGVPAEIYNHGIFVNENTRNGTFINIIAFVGRRWFAGLYSRAVLAKAVGNGTHITTNDLAKFFPEEIHSYYGPLATLTEYNAGMVLYLSEPVDAGSYKDKYTPIGVQWYQAANTGFASENADEVQPVDSLLICGRCSETNPCFNSGFCNDQGLCECVVGFTGSLCEEKEPCTSFKNDTFAGCFNDGTCNEETGTCTCPGSYYGRLCQLNFFKGEL